MLNFVKIHVSVDSLQRLSRNTKLLVVALTGLSLSILVAGYLLSRHRRRYRAITSTSSDSSSRTSHLSRQETFRVNGRTPFRSTASFDANHRTFPPTNPVVSPLSRDLPDSDRSSDDDDDMFVDSSDQPLPCASGQMSTDGLDYASDCSEDSFHSTVESVDTFMTHRLDRNHFYMLALEQVDKGLVRCRTIRTEMLACGSDGDFLAKLYCIRLAFTELLNSQTDRDYFKQLGQDIMASFLRNAKHDPTLFCERFANLTEFLEGEGGRQIAEGELTKRRVVCMNLYDVALDFVLLDAFDDLEHPPGTIVAVLQNRWITDGMKQAALSAAVWSLLKAKKSMLQNKDGFMSRFYLMSETLTPVLAWGFLGTDGHLRQQCLLFRGTVLSFLQSIFSLESVRYTTVNSLADDILQLAQRTVNTMVSS